MRALVDWWDAVELWVTQLLFGFQMILVVLLVLPACALVAAAVDRATAHWDTPSESRTNGTVER